MLKLTDRKLGPPVLVVPKILIDHQLNLFHPVDENFVEV